jgi:SAM-dependent methyltransferase
LAAKSRVLADMAPGRLLDIGAQKGEFLWYMRERGWQVEGVELDNAVPNPQGLPIHYGDFLEMNFEAATFDAVTAWAVLEHVQDPRRFVEKAAALLKPGGRLVALVTNLNSIQGRWFRADDYPRHLTLFTRRSVRDLARRYGLTVTRIWTDQSVFGGALNGGLVFLVKRLGGYSADEAFQEWRQIDDPLQFWAKWRGKPSALVLNASRLDRAITWFPERMLDALGYGFIMTFILQKPENHLI